MLQFVALAKFTVRVRGVHHLVVKRTQLTELDTCGRPIDFVHSRWNSTPHNSFQFTTYTYLAVSTSGSHTKWKPSSQKTSGVASPWAPSGSFWCQVSGGQKLEGPLHRYCYCCWHYLEPPVRDIDSLTRHVMGEVPLFLVFSSARRLVKVRTVCFASAAGQRGRRCSMLPFFILVWRWYHSESWHQK